MPTEHDQNVARLLRANRILERLGLAVLYTAADVPDLHRDELSWAAETTERLATAAAYAMRGIL